MYEITVPSTTKGAPGVVAEGLGKRYDTSSGRSATSTSRSPPAPCSACSATTAPARRPRSASSPRSRCRPPAARSVAGFDVVAEPARRARADRRGRPGRRPSTGCSAGARTSRWSAASTTCRAPRRAQRAGELLERLGLADAADRLVKTYSGGMRRRLDLAASLVATAGPVPRRADHRARPPEPQRALGAAARARRATAPRWCSPPSTSRRPTGSPTRSSCSTTAASPRHGSPAELKARIGGERVDGHGRRRRRARRRAAAALARVRRRHPLDRRRRAAT